MGRGDEEDEELYENEEEEEEDQEEEEEDKPESRNGRSKNKKQDDEEEEEEEEENEEDEEDEEGGRKGKSKEPEKPVFKEPIRPPNPDVDSFEMLLPNRNDGKPAVVRVRLSQPRTPFEERYRRQLKALRRENILRSLADDEAQLKEFVAQEQAARAAAEEAGLDPDEDDAENGDDAYEEEDAENGGRPYPYWLRYLIAKDALYTERTWSCMFGWLVGPPPQPASVVKALHGGREGRVSFKNTDGGGEEEDEEEEEFMADPVRKTSKYFQQSGAFQEKPADADEEDDEEGQEEDAEQQQQADGADGLPGALPGADDGDDDAQAADPNDANTTLRPTASIVKTGKHERQTSIKPPPLTALPAFPHLSYPLFICRDTVSESWHLLDRHPQLAEKRFKREAEEAAERKARGEDRTREDEEAEEEDEDEAEEALSPRAGDEEGEEEEDGDEEAAGRGRGKRLPRYDLATLVRLDALMLAAHLCPAALRIMLLQDASKVPRIPGPEDEDYGEGAGGGGAADDENPESRLAQAPYASLLRYLSEWLHADLYASFGLLATIYQTLLAVRSKESSRIPHAIPPIPLDFNVFFSPGYVFSLPGTPRLLSVASTTVATGATTSRDQALVAPASAEGRAIMQALLQAGIVPSTPILLRRLRDWESLQLLLWLLMVMPRSLLVLWGDLAKWRARQLRDGAGGANRDNDEDEEDEDEDEEGQEAQSLSESLILEKIATEAHKRRRERQRAEGPAMLPAPFLLQLLLEIRRRNQREQNGKLAPLHPLSLHLERYYKAKQLEDNKPLGDPLVTSLFALPSTVAIISSFTDGSAGRRASQSMSDLELRTQVLFVQHAASEDLQACADPALAAQLKDARGAANDETALNSRGIRHQRVYQSDLALMLLALTATLLPRRPAVSPPPPASVGFSMAKPNANAQSLNMSGAWGAASGTGGAGLAGSGNSGGGGGDSGRKSGMNSPSNPLPLSLSGLVSVRRAGGGGGGGGGSNGANGVGGDDSFTNSMRESSNVSVTGGAGGVVLGSSHADGNLELFQTLLRDKLSRPRSPLDRTRSSTFRLLYLSLPRFRRFALMRALCAVSPLYSLFGAAQPSPLAELVLCWSMERKGTLGAKSSYLDIFLNTFWLELHMRLVQYAQEIDLSVAQFVRMRMIIVLDKINDRYGRYQNMLNMLTGGDGGKSSITANATAAAAQAKLGIADDGVNLRTLTPYSAVYRDEENRVRAVFEALSTTLEERSFVTPEMLFSLLFGGSQRRRDVVAVRYIVVNKGITTVRENPFTANEMNALECAIRRRDYPVARLLVGLGYSLAEHVDDGSQTLGSLAEALLPAVQASELWRAHDENENIIAADPRVNFGILRPIRC